MKRDSCNQFYKERVLNLVVQFLKRFLKIPRLQLKGVNIKIARINSWFLCSGWLDIKRITKNSIFHNKNCSLLERLSCLYGGPVGIPKQLESAANHRKKRTHFPKERNKTQLNCINFH